MIYNGLRFQQFILRHGLKVGKVKAQRVCRNAGTCLLNMLAEYLSQCRVKQVSCRMVTCRMIAVFQIYLAMHGFIPTERSGNSLHLMDKYILFLGNVQNLSFKRVGGNGSPVRGRPPLSA